MALCTLVPLTGPTSGASGGAPRLPAGVSNAPVTLGASGCPGGLCTWRTHPGAGCVALGLARDTRLGWLTSKASLCLLNRAPGCRPAACLMVHPYVLMKFAATLAMWAVQGPGPWQSSRSSLTMSRLHYSTTASTVHPGVPKVMAAAIGSESVAGRLSATLADCCDPDSPCRSLPPGRPRPGRILVPTVPSWLRS